MKAFPNNLRFTLSCVRWSHIIPVNFLILSLHLTHYHRWLKLTTYALRLAQVYFFCLMSPRISATSICSPTHSAIFLSLNVIPLILYSIACCTVRNFLSSFFLLLQVSVPHVITRSMQWFYTFCLGTAADHLHYLGMPTVCTPTHPYSSVNFLFMSRLLC